MIVIGKFHEETGPNLRNFASGGYVALDANYVAVRTYTGRATTDDERCYLELGAELLVTFIRKENGGYIDPPTGNSLVKEIAMRSIVCLDDFGCRLFRVCDRVPD